MAGTNRRTYLARATSWMLSAASTGTKQIAVEFAILTEGADVPNITWFGFLSPAAFDRTIEALRTCGWQGDDLSVIDSLDAEVQLVIDDEEYKGKFRPKVQFINRPGANMVEPLAGDEAKAFAASMRDRIRALDAANAKKTGTAKSNSRTGALSPEPPPISEEDLPF